MEMSKSEEEIIGCLPKEGWISAEQLALYLNVDKKTLKRHIERLGISRVVIAGKWLISIADFERVKK
jgi:predicted ArsR family transcriptional regulator